MTPSFVWPIAVPVPLAGRRCPPEPGHRARLLVLRRPACPLPEKSETRLDRIAATVPIARASVPHAFPASLRHSFSPSRREPEQRDRSAHIRHFDRSLPLRADAPVASPPFEASLCWTRAFACDSRRLVRSSSFGRRLIP